MTNKRPRNPKTATVVEFPNTPRKRALIKNKKARDQFNDALDLVRSHGYLVISTEFKSMLDLYMETNDHGQKVILKMMKKVMAENPRFGGNKP